MTIHPVDGGYVISSRGAWLPGVYATERAARYAFRFSNEELADLYRTRGHRPTTTEALRELRYATTPTAAPAGSEGGEPLPGLAV